MNEYKSRGYLLDDFRLFHLNDAAGAKVDYHYHEFCKLLLLRSGSGGYMVEGHRYSLEAGDVVLIGSHCVHRPEFDSGAPCERIIIYISPAFLRRQSGGSCDLSDVFSGGGGHVLRPGEKQRRQLFSLAARLEREIAEEGYGHVILGNVLLLQLLVEIARNQRSGSAALPSPVQPGNSRVQDILRYIDAHLAEDITIDHLSEQFYISKYHMMRLFRRETGQSIHSYLSDRRLLHARALIAGGMSATESCFRSGFRSYSSFTRAYAKRFGTTPTGRSAQLEEIFE
ncbi:MAG: helix-turn-helix domain-containing protein [Oscillospiraceae bacterium]|nr:helix-turn-helix domain-containing protein [Oscillospiraceae bacterium]MBQ8238354.1 helix-turn-helix domain-containing protein [Oscillospiraceae bacterium]